MDDKCCRDPKVGQTLKQQQFSRFQSEDCVLVRNPIGFCFARVPGRAVCLP
jgi:hypothetical protein